MDLNEVKSTYPELLKKYLFEGKEEEALYGAYMLGKECFEAKIAIEEVMNVHTHCLEDILKTIPPSSVHDVVLKSSNLLIEFSIRFGLVCQDYFEILQQTDEKIRHAFYQAGEALTAGLDIQKMLSVIVDIVKNLIEAAGCAIMLLEEDRFVIKASQDLDEENKIFKEFLLEVINEGTTRTVFDLREEKYQIFLKDGREIRSVLVLPLNLKGKIIGALGIYLTVPHHFDEKDISLLTSFSYQAASAINNAKLYKEVKDKAEHISALYGIARAAKASLDIAELFDAMVVEMRNILSFDRTSINLLKKEMVEVFAQAGEMEIPELGTGTRIPVEKSSTMFIIDRRAGLFRNIEATPFYEDAILFEKGIRSVIQVPLVSKGERIGVLSLESCTPDVYSRRDLDIAQAIADQISNSLENVRLYEELKQANLELEKRLKELEEFQTLAVGRELKMVEMKRRIGNIEGK